MSNKDVSRLTVLWTSESFPMNLTSCLGWRSLDKGHSRVPDPPANRTGYTFDSFFMV